MTQQVETRQVVADERGDADRLDRPKGDNQFNMVQGIRREIAEMLAAKKRGFSADDYQLLGREGILTEDDRIELIDGEIVLMSPIGNRHTSCVDRLTHTFVNAVIGRAIVRVQGSIRLGDDSEPQPDIALLRPRDDFYADAYSAAEDILLVVEVADSSLTRDRQKTRETYAKHRLPEVWIANLRDDCVERYHNLRQDNYGNMERFMRGDTISPEMLPDVRLRVDDILP